MTIYVVKMECDRLSFCSMSLKFTKKFSDVENMYSVFEAMEINPEEYRGERTGKNSRSEPIRDRLNDGITHQAYDITLCISVHLHIRY